MTVGGGRGGVEGAPCIRIKGGVVWYAARSGGIEKCRLRGYAMNTDATYRVGLIGTGRKGNGHARGYVANPRTELVAAADPDPSNLAIFLERFTVKPYDDYHEMLRVENVDIAAPILPVKPNPGVVIDCARAGVKAIYCEKPMAASLDEADRMVEETSSRGIALASGDAYRNMPQHWKVKALIDSGELGPVQSINLYQPTNEISGGGCQGLSVLRLFADDADVEWVTGWCAEDPQSDEDQNMGGYVKFANGTDAYVHTKPSPKDGIEVVCEKGIYHTSWFGGHLWTSTRRGEATGRGRGLLRRVRRDGLRVGDAQWSEAAGGHPVDRRGAGQRHRAEVQRRQHAEGAGDRHRVPGVAPQRVLRGPIPHRGQEPEDRPQARALAEQEGGLRGGGVCGDDWSGV